MFAIRFGSIVHLKTIYLQMEQIIFKCCMAEEFVLPLLSGCVLTVRISRACQNHLGFGICISDKNANILHKYKKTQPFDYFLHEGSVTFSTGQLSSARFLECTVFIQSLSFTFQSRLAHSLEVRNSWDNYPSMHRSSFLSVVLLSGFSRNEWILIASSLVNTCRISCRKRVICWLSF